MDAGEMEILRLEVDALSRELAEERFRHVAGLEGAPSIEPLFRARSRAAHRATVAALRDAGAGELALRVASLRGERAVAAEEEAWRAAESAAVALGPGGSQPLAAAELGVLAEPDRRRRQELGRAAAAAAAAAATHREAAAERRAAARAESGLTPPWEDVVQADALLDESEDAYREALSWAATREGLPTADLDRADLRHLLALRRYDGLFRPAPLAAELPRAFRGMGLDAGRVRLDAADRPLKWPGAHVFEERVSFRRQGGATDWMALFAAAGEAVAAAARAPSAREPDFPSAMGALAVALFTIPRFLEGALGVERRHLPDLVRSLALRRLFELRVRAAALRVAAESERGLSGAAWRAAHREALSAAAHAAWPEGLAARDADASALAASLRGAALGEALRQELVERYDVDYYRNPRTQPAIAGLVAAGSARPGKERPPLAVAAGALSRLIERGG